MNPSLMRPRPEHHQPQQEGRLGESLGQVEAGGGGGDLSPQQVLGAQQDRQTHQRQQEDDVEVEEAVDQIELGGLSAVQVGAVGGEDIVEDDVEAGEDRLAVVVAITEELGGEDGEGGEDRPGDEEAVLPSEYQDIYSYGQTYQSCEGPT